MYDGYDIDMGELCLAKEHYDNIYELDLTDVIDELSVKKYDKIICLNTLEHVRDAATSIHNISNMLNQDGSIYLKLPCKHAVFAKINLSLNQEIKKKYCTSYSPVNQVMDLKFFMISPHQKNIRKC